MLSNRIFLLGLVAFGVSFGFMLVTTGDLKHALITGFVTVPATYIGAIVVDKRRRNYEMLVLNSLHKHIQELELEETGLHQSLTAARGKKQELVTNVNVLQTEITNLRSQVSERRNQREDLNRDLTNLRGQIEQSGLHYDQIQAETQELEKSKGKIHQSLSLAISEQRRVETNLGSLRLQLTQLEIQIDQQQSLKLELESNITLLNRIKPQLEEKLHTLRLELQDMETRHSEKQLLEKNVNNLRTELAELQNEVVATQENQAALNQELTKLNESKHESELNLQHLQEQIKNLESVKVDEQSEQQKQQLESSLLVLQAELEQTKEQVLSLYEERDQLQSPNWSESPNERESELEDDDFPFADLLDTLEPLSNQSHSPEWMEFIEQLPNHEKQVLKAIVLTENPTAVIKKIAEEHVTMPALLIDAINELANQTVGDLIIEPGSEPPQIVTEYANTVRELMLEQ
jgi:chromosome segregation ATPase